MKKARFKVYLEYDPEYQGYVADVPALPGCMSQGKSEEEAMKNIHEAIEGYLKVLRAEGKTIPIEEVKYVEVGV